MLIVEYRIPLPYSVEEFRIGQMYMIARGSLESTHGGEGIEIVDSEPYVTPDGNSLGTYTYKRLHAGSNVPRWVRSLLPANALTIDEYAYNAYPTTQTSYYCPIVGECLSMSVDSRYHPGVAHPDNLLELTDDELEMRKVCLIDVAYDGAPEISGHNLDPSVVEVAVDRPPLEPGWMESRTPIMCVYKVVKINFDTRVPGLASRVEAYLQSVCKQTFFLAFRNVCAWGSGWCGLPPRVVHSFEDYVNILLKQSFDPTFTPALVQSGFGCAVSDDVYAFVCLSDSEDEFDELGCDDVSSSSVSFSSTTSRERLRVYHTTTTTTTTTPTTTTKEQHTHAQPSRQQQHVSVCASDSDCGYVESASDGGSAYASACEWWSESSDSWSST